jgi:hypothetical protein|tara:strand:+ start:1482 stop:1646 length:165 start_codon:yes stop_codon:yes gene_type:complete
MSTIWFSLFRGTDAYERTKRIGTLDTDIADLLYPHLLKIANKKGWDYVIIDEED